MDTALAVSIILLCGGDRSAAAAERRWGESPQREENVPAAHF